VGIPFIHPEEVDGHRGLGLCIQEYDIFNLTRNIYRELRSMRGHMNGVQLWRDTGNFRRPRVGTKGQMGLGSLAKETAATNSGKSHSCLLGNAPCV